MFSAIRRSLLGPTPAAAAAALTPETGAIVLHASQQDKVEMIFASSAYSETGAPERRRAGFATEANPEMVQYVKDVHYEPRS